MLVTRVSSGSALSAGGSDGNEAGSGACEYFLPAMRAARNKLKGVPVFSRLKRYPRLLFFGFGFIVTVASVALILGSDLATASLGYPVRISWPYWMGAIRWVIGYLPWIALAGALAARLYCGSGIRLFSFAGGLATPYIALITYLTVGPVLEDHWHRQPFNAAAWRSAEEDCPSYWTVRSTMAKDMVNSGIIRGKTKAQIELLLGPSDEFSTIRAFGSQSFDTSKWGMGYCLGAKSWAHPYFVEWLVVKIGPDGKAEDTAFVPDYRIP